MAYKVSQLCVMADFLHKSSIEELHLNLPQNCHTKHCTRHYAKTLLCAALLFLLPVFQSFIVSFYWRWLDGSFAKLGFSLVLCGFINVPQIALAILAP
jgi:hypothetical protein